MERSSLYPGIIVNDSRDLQTGGVAPLLSSFLRIVNLDRNIAYEYNTDIQDLGEEDVSFFSIFSAYYITEYTERYTEGGVAVSTLADTFIFNSTGAMPIELFVTGYISKLALTNHRNTLLNMYDGVMRGSALQKNSKVLEIGIKNTLYTCYPINLNWVEDTNYVDYSILTMSLIAFKYITLPSFIKVFYTGDLVKKAFSGGGTEEAFSITKTIGNAVSGLFKK